MPALPTGTVTFLFTDIEGSTARWEHQREAMAAALVRHDALVRSAIEAHGGHVFKTVGDAFCAAFAGANDAIAAAVAAQRAVASEDWAAFGVDFPPTVPDGVRLRDRGEHRLKDLRHTEPIVQDLVDGLPDVVKALRTAGELSARDRRAGTTHGVRVPIGSRRTPSRREQSGQHR